MFPNQLLSGLAPGLEGIRGQQDLEGSGALPPGRQQFRAHTKSQGESQVCWLGCSPGREAPGSQTQERAAKWNSTNREGLEILNAAWLGGASWVGGMSLNPLGEGREFNVGLKPRGKVLSLHYNYRNGMVFLQPLSIAVDIWLFSQTWWILILQSPTFCGTFLFFPNAKRFFSYRTDNYSHSPVWQYPTMPWKVPRTCLHVQMEILSLEMVWWTVSQGWPLKSLMDLAELIAMKREWRIFLSW